MPEVRLEINARKSGAPPDSVVLSDPTGAFGMRRQDTQQVVVADSTAMVQDATNPAKWTYTYASGVAGVTYEWWAEVTFGTDVHHYEATETAPAVYEDDLVISVGDADAIIQANVPAANRRLWDALGDDAKAIQLRDAQGEINAGTWKGRKVESDEDLQPFAFPRYDDDASAYVGGGDAETLPKRVTDAIALIAWSKADNAPAWARMDLRSGGGVSAHAVSGVSESFEQSGARAVAELRLRVCAAAWARLEKLWRRGGVLV